MLQKRLAHYLANAGCTRFVSYEDLAPGGFELCLQFVSHGRHRLPLTGYHLVVAANRTDQGWPDGAHAALLHESRVVGVLTTCLSAAAAKQLWAQFETYYLGATDRGALARADWPLPRMPKVAPWVASFPLQCTTALEHEFLSEFAPAWAYAFAVAAVNETRHPVE